jgi:protein O-mannosyl-transferase
LWTREAHLLKPERDIAIQNEARSLKTYLLCLLIVVLVGVLYFNSLGNQFTNWDDGMIYQNPTIRHLDWKGVKRIFTLEKGNTYQPIRALSYAIDYRTWKLNPFGYHLTNIFFYILTCIVVFQVLRLLSIHLRGNVPNDSHRRLALFGGLLFAAHPVHVEAVTWLAARKEVLQGFFFFLGFFLYLRGRAEEGKRRMLYFSLVLFFVLLAMLSKPAAVIFPGVVLLYEIARGQEKVFNFVKKQWVFVGLSLLVSGIFTYILMKVMFEAGGIKPYRGATLLSNALVPLYAFLQNIILLTSTVNYSAAYSFSVAMPVWAMKNILLVGLTIGIFIFVFYSLRWTKVIFFSFFFFLITLLPYLNIIPISTLLADRYVFIASFSYSFLVGLLFDRLYRYRPPRVSEGFVKLLSICLFLFLLMGYSFMTMRQNTIWQNSYTLWSDAVEKHPNSNLANALMGVVCMELNLDDQAVKYLEKAIELLPYDYQSRNNLGIVYSRTREFDKGINELMIATRLRPDDDTIKINLAVLYERMQDYERSEEMLGHLISRNPKSADLHYRIALLFIKEGRVEEAVSEYKKAIELAPNIINPYEALGNIYLNHFSDVKTAKLYYLKGMEAAPGAKLRVEELRQVIQDLEGSQ